MDFSQFTSFATLVIACCAFFSPIVTCFLNNWHQYQMKQLEYSHADKLRHEEWMRNVYDGYIQAADACIHAPAMQTFAEFGRHSGLVMRYVPEDVRQKMLAFEKSFYRSSNGEVYTYSQRIDMLSDIITCLQQLKELP